MSWQVLWSATAAADQLAIVEWIHENNPTAALHFLNELEAKVGLLSTQPTMAPIWERHPSMGVRRLHFKAYLIYYEILPERREVLILTVRHGRRKEPVLTE